MPNPNQVRILRILEYTYESAEAMVEDMIHWQVQTIYAPSVKVVIKSTTLTPEILQEAYENPLPLDSI